MQYENLIYRLYSNFDSCLTNILYSNFFFSGPGLHLTFTCQVILVSLNVERFLSLPLSFKILTFLKSMSYLFHRVALNLDLPNVSSWLDADCILWEVIIQCKECGVLSASHQETVCHDWWCVTLITWLKVVLPGFSM